MMMAKSVRAFRVRVASDSRPWVAAMAASIAPHVDRPSRVEAPRSASTVFSPIERAGTLMIRSKLTTSVSERSTRR